MKKLLPSPNLWIMMALDAALVVAAFWGAYLIRFEFRIPDVHLDVLRFTWPFILLIKMGCFAFFHLYRGMWRYTSLVDLINVVKAVFTSSAVILAAVLVVHRFQGYPRSVFFYRRPLDPDLHRGHPRGHSALLCPW
jgi:FlaA1/EpsC-like NDP-sugar epimerase